MSFCVRCIRPAGLVGVGPNYRTLPDAYRKTLNDIEAFLRPATLIPPTRYRCIKRLPGEKPRGLMSEALGARSRHN